MKKRVSLADYKKRKQRASESGGTGTPTTAPSTPNLATGLPSSMPSLPSLPSLPGLDMPSQTFARSKAEKLQDKGEELFFFFNRVVVYHLSSHYLFTFLTNFPCLVYPSFLIKKFS